MSEIKAKNIDNQLINIQQSSIESLRKQIRGEVITPYDEGYDKVRVIWNSMIDRRPALIIRCSGTADVIKAVLFAKEHQLLISIRGGGHNLAGRSLQNDVLLIDLSKLRYVHVDPEERIATVSPGAILGDIDNETLLYNLILPVGINSTTGIAGLTLGGGFGWTSRKFGMTVDSLISAEIVTVNGERIICSQDVNEDLFWAIKGGGGNFGIVTSFKFRLHDFNQKIYLGPVIFDIKDSKKVIAKYREFCKNLPNELTVWIIIRQCLPIPSVDPSYIGKVVLIVAGVYSGPIQDGKVHLSKIKELGNPIYDGLAVFNFLDFQKFFDPLLAPGARNYWKAENFKEIDDQLIDILFEYATHLPSDNSEILINHMEGAIKQISQDSAAYPHRNIKFIMNFISRWTDKKDDDVCLSWTRSLFDKAKPFSIGGTYVNFISEGDDDSERAYSQNLNKLAAIKAKYDPKNVLRSNINITPR